MAFMVLAAGSLVQAQNFTVLHKFNLKDGQNPQGALAQDKAGNLYGTTVRGGSIGNGTVFKLSAGGKETVLHSFSGRADGGSPYAGLIPDGQNNFYGLAFVGVILLIPMQTRAPAEPFSKLAPLGD
jgi:uncharacterized repeat protein (TIGR03803 family)